MAKQKLATPISLSVYKEAKAALFRNGQTVQKITLQPGEKTAVYLAPIADDKLPKNLATGNYLFGSLTLGHPEISAIAKRICYPARYTILEWGKRHGTALSTVHIEKKKSNVFGQKEISESVRDHEIALLSKCTDPELAKIYTKEMLEKYPKHLPLMVSELNRLVKLKKNTDEKYYQNNIKLIWEK